MKLRDLIKTQFHRVTKYVLRTAVESILDEDEEEEVIGGHERGQLGYTFKGQFMEGTTLRQMMSGATALTALWVDADEETAYLANESLMPGVYQVRVKLDVIFEPVDEEAMIAEALAEEELEENGIPVYDAKDLIKAIKDKED